MKKTTMAFIILLLVLGAYFAYDAKWGKSVFLKFYSEDLNTINRISLSFMEDIRFKDFKKAASYHNEDDRKKVNIAKKIEKLFRIKPELLDIMEYEVMESSLDSTKKRGRVKLKAKVHVLNLDKIKNVELILYYKKKDGAWYMELESSLKGF